MSSENRSFNAGGLSYFEARRKEVQREKDKEVKRQQQRKRIERQKLLEEQATLFNEEEENRRRAVWGLPSKPHKSKAALEPKTRVERLPEESSHPAFLGGVTKRLVGEVDVTHPALRTPVFSGYRATWEPVGEIKKILKRKSLNLVCYMPCRDCFTAN